MGRFFSEISEEYGFSKNLEANIAPEPQANKGCRSEWSPLKAIQPNKTEAPKALSGVISNFNMTVAIYIG